MWWSRSLIVLSLVALGPVGCGFRPVYGHNDAGTAPEIEALASVRVAGIEDRMGQQLRNELVRRLTPRGEPGGSRYLLQAKLTQTMAGLAESSDGNATVGSMQIQCVYTLVDSRTGATVMTGQTRSMANFRYLGPRYASVVSERDTEQLALADLADEIRAGLMAWFIQRESGGRGSAQAQP